METKRKLIAAVDAGTTGTRCCIMDAYGTIVSGGYYPMKTFYPSSGLAEQDPSTVIDLTFRAVADAVAQVDPREIIGLCVTVQRNSFVPVAEDGTFLSNMVLWQDQRGEQVHPWIRERLAANGLTQEDFYRMTGQPFGSFQFGFKALWFRHLREDIYRKTYKFVTPQAILTRAFGVEEYREENNNLSFWLLADPDTQKFDPELCRIFDFDAGKFPVAVDPGTMIGTVSEEASHRCGLLAGTPIYAGSGDQNCGALGAGNYGTSDIMSICMGTAGLVIAYSPVPVRHPKGLCQIQGHPAGGYLMETHSSSCMSSYRWAENILYPQDPGDHKLMTSAAMSAPAGAHGVLFLPYLQGAACPNYDDAARGAYIGMSLGSDRNDLCRATMEGICFENRMMLETLQEGGLPEAKSLRVIGGASNNSFWNQMQADIYGIPVETITAKEATTLGAAIICAVASGLYGSYREASENMTRVLTHYTPNADIHESYRPVYEIWDRCYRDLSRGTFDALYAYQKGLEE
ncbi:MAG: hypothetical protein IJL66_02825 [Lachnospiraceae bacterium]|nr:hypothetical protein [Lachnospiraceae bacterium]